MTSRTHRTGKAPGGKERAALIVSFDGGDVAATEAAAIGVNRAGFITSRKQLAELAEFVGVCESVAENYQLVVTVGALDVDGGTDVAALTAAQLDHPMPGAEELLRRVQYDAGYHRAVFETARVGLIDSTVVINLPTDGAAMRATLDHLIGLIPGLLDENDDQGRAPVNLLDRHFQVVPPDADKSTELPAPTDGPDATIFHMPRPTDGPDDGRA